MANIFISEPDELGFYYKLKFYEFSGTFWYSIYRKGKFFKIRPRADENSTLGYVSRKDNEPAESYVGRVKNEAIERIVDIKRRIAYNNEVKTSLNHAWNVMIEKIKEL